jgi:hypothetical protein
MIGLMELFRNRSLDPKVDVDVWVLVAQMPRWASKPVCGSRRYVA